MAHSIPMSPLLSPTQNGYQGPAQQTLSDKDGEDEVDPLAAVVTGKWAPQVAKAELVNIAGINFVLVLFFHLIFCF